MSHLWSANTPAQFWLVEPNPPDTLWEIAIRNAMPILPASSQAANLDEVLKRVLGEEQFGANRWRFSGLKDFYYSVKPFLPSALRRAIRRMISKHSNTNFHLDWPVEPRYAQFQWEVMRQLLLITGEESLSFRAFWPHQAQYAFALSHDIETAEGQAHVRAVADLEESLGFRSSFAFVPERYPLDYELMDELRTRGFEIAVHGLKHDGKDFKSHAEFLRRAPRINHYLKAFNTRSFYAALTLRQPEWMQVLEIDYDRSFFDTDPYEPNSGGVMSIWPFRIGHFLELPYTLAQDYTIAILLQEREPRIWLEKLKFIKQYHGMALMVTHPDYLKEKPIERLYRDFLMQMKDDNDYWFGLPRDVARWWRERSANCGTSDLVQSRARARLTRDNLLIELAVLVHA